MKTYLTLQNYRCFVRPVTVEIAPGFTAFVGVNNAGKSTLMRFLLEARPLLATLGEPNNIRLYVNQEASPTSFLHSNQNTNPINFSLRFQYDSSEKPPSHLEGDEEYRIVINRDMQMTRTIFVGGQALSEFGQITSIEGQEITFGGGKRFSVSPLVNVLRSLSNSLYIGPFRNTINAGGRSDYLDIQVGHSFITQFRQLKTGDNKKLNAEISRLTDDIRRVFQFDSLDISPTADDSSLHLTVNNRHYKQHEVGSGLTHFVIVLTNVAITKPKWVLIDEPELNLHPALQLDFLTTLAKYAQEGVWFSSHSIGLARSAASRVYSVVRISEGDSDIRLLEGTARLAEFLGEMSFSSHKELGFDKVLLVEGPTEVPMFQQLLRMVGKDRTVLQLPLHGHMPAAEELEEMLRITTHIAAIIDSERDSADAKLPANRARFLQLCESKGIRAQALDRRAIENYFPEAAIKRTFGDQYRALRPYERLRDVNPHWGKNQNWKVAGAMTFDDIKETDLGQFLLAL
jgi:predicted ATPase